MTKPGDPEKGKAAQHEQAEAEAAGAKEAAGTEAAARDAQAGAPAEDVGDEATPSPAEGTAAELTGVGKDAAAAALREGSTEPRPGASAEPVSEAEHPEAEAGAVEDTGAAGAAGEPVSEAEHPEAEAGAVEDTGTAASDADGDAEPAPDEEAAEAEAEADLAKTDEPEPAAAEEAAPAARRRGRRGRRGRGGATAEPETTAEPGATAEPDAGAEPAAPEPAPTRRAPVRREGEQVLVRAQAKYVRTSARKARLVCDHIRGKSVQEARAILAHTPRAVARDWSKLLESAIANAEHNHELIGDDLRVIAVTADEGPTLKRFRPRAMGRATRIRKRTSHLTITLTPKE